MHNKSLLVHQGRILAWAAQLDYVPVAVRVAEICGNPGMIVMLSDTGMQDCTGGCLMLQ